MPCKTYGFTQSSYPALYLPSDEDYKTLSLIGYAKLHKRVEIQKPGALQI